MPVSTLLFLSAAKAALLVGAALLLVNGVPRAAASVRHAVLFLALAATLLLPFFGAVLPTFSPIGIPSGLSSRSPELAELTDRVVEFLLVRSDRASGLPGRSIPPAAAHASTAILVVWFFGTAAVLIGISTDLLAARRVRSQATPRGRIGGTVPVLVSAEIGAPVTVGLVRPVIILPALVPFESRALQSVFAHELAHVERRDCLTQLVVRLACAVYWFNPLVWRAARRTRLDQERACDDRVLAGGVDPIAYSELLIDVARQARPGPRLHAVSSMAGPGQLERRIAGILDASVPRGGLSRSRLAGLAVAVLSAVAPLAAFGVHDVTLSQDPEDPYFDPQSERAPGSRDFDQDPPAGESNLPDGALIAALRCAAVREPSAPADLVPDRARWALSLADGGRLVEPMIEKLNDEDWRVSAYAAWTLAMSEDSRAVPPLVRLLDHPVWRLRAMAAAALNQLADPRAASGMSRAAGDAAWQVRAEVAGYLGTLGEAGYREQMETLRNDPHIAVRLAAADALDRLK